MKKLYKFEWDCGRMGEIEGLFIAEETEVNKSIGSYVYFGEILGKHSEVSGPLEEKDFTAISEDQDLIDQLSSIFTHSSLCGYNPLDYINEDE